MRSPLIPLQDVITAWCFPLHVAGRLEDGSKARGKSTPLNHSAQCSGCAVRAATLTAVHPSSSPSHLRWLGGPDAKPGLLEDVHQQNCSTVFFMTSTVAAREIIDRNRVLYNSFLGRLFCKRLKCSICLKQSVIWDASSPRAG